MNLLIVDDQASVVEGLSRGIAWKMMGFENVYTAYNAAEAREILKKYEIQVMLCDIEMPVENGLSLLGWMRGEQMETECIFLTAHADFEYMQEAIRVRGFDYILQPAPYDEIRRAVYSAVCRVLENQKRREVYDYGAAMLNEQRNLKSGIIHELLSGSLGREQYERYLSGLQLPGWEQDCYLLLLVFRQQERIRQMGTEMMPFILDNIGHELFNGYETDLVVGRQEECRYFLLLYGKQSYLIDREGVARQSRILLEHLQKFADIHLSVYISEPTAVSGVKENWEKLLCREENNVMKRADIFMGGALEETGEDQAEFLSDIPFSRWEKYLEEGYTEAARLDIGGWLTGMGNDGLLSRRRLEQFYIRFVQMLGKVSGARGIPGKEILAERAEACSSVPDMMELVDEVFAHLTDAHEETDVIGRVREYIRDHVGSEIRRSDLAELVHMNSDYLNRIFKRETGTTIGDYILNEKMQIARNLLQTTTLPVSYVASRVGYENFSHFSRTYKRVFGVSPSEERR